MTILIYSHTSTTRLQYICKFIFGEQLGIGHSLTIDSESFKNHDGAKINYSDLAMPEDAFTICNHPLLFQKEVKEIDVDSFESNGHTALFKTTDGDFSFDVMAASFYLLSRYEEYLPHEQDSYGRYAHENSIAYRKGFLQQPLVNIWINNLADALLKKFPALQLKKPTFNFVPTYDVDIAWSYKHKGFIRNIGGLIKAPSLGRLAVLAGLKKDPFDSFDYLHQLHRRYQLHPVYFFLVAQSVSDYDKNISPYHYAMWRLVKKHAKQYSIGLHPSWKSNEKPGLMEREQKILASSADVPVTNSRQHYIKFALPKTFEQLAAAGIKDDYSMGYGSINGFRASVASSFNWYNLATETSTALRLHPFCYMDANSFYEQQQNVAKSYEELMHYYQACKAVNGELITIFHNNFLGTDKKFAGWKEMYETFLEQLDPVPQAAVSV